MRLYLLLFTAGSHNRLLWQPWKAEKSNCCFIYVNYSWFLISNSSETYIWNKLNHQFIVVQLKCNNCLLVWGFENNWFFCNFASYSSAALTLLFSWVFFLHQETNIKNDSAAAVHVCNCWPWSHFCNDNPSLEGQCANFQHGQSINLLSAFSTTLLAGWFVEEALLLWWIRFSVLLRLFYVPLLSLQSAEILISPSPLSPECHQSNVTCSPGTELMQMQNIKIFCCFFVFGSNSNVLWLATGKYMTRP